MFAKFCCVQEWKGFYDELYDALEQQMRENKVQSFAGLSEPEQNLLLGKALQSIQGGVKSLHLELKNLP